MHDTTDTIFIADLHLSESTADFNQLFIKFLACCSQRHVTHLYILGDLFEAWIGDDDHHSFHDEIIHALAKAAKNGLSIYFMKGNRDFLLGKHFLNQAHCIGINDKTIIDLYGQKTLLVHGDHLCARDKTYLRWRQFSRCSLINTLLFLIWPLSFRRWIANKLRQKSKSYTQAAHRDIMDVVESVVKNEMIHYDVELLIHGHTHRPAIHYLSLDENNKQVKRIVLGAWHDEGEIFAVNANGNQQLIPIRHWINLK